VGPSAATLLLERERELAVADGVLDAAAAGTGRVLVVAGEPGIGKTALVDAAVRRARERGFAVVAATGGALEGDFPFGVARQLFEPVATPELLAGAAGAAAPALGLGRVADEASEAGQRALSFELQHGLYWLAANLAERAPVLVAVDDAQWADRDSLGFLVYLARRLDELPVALLVATRDGEATAAGEALAALRALPGVAEAEPEPLSGRRWGASSGGRSARTRSRRSARPAGRSAAATRSSCGRCSTTSARRACARRRTRSSACGTRARRRCSATCSCASLGSGPKRSRSPRPSPSSSATPTSSPPLGWRRSASPPPGPPPTS
jgi:hypothetical protein